MRLDLFLKTSRLVLRRSVAQQMCDAGRVKVGGLKAKSGKEVKENDEIEIRRRDRAITVKIKQIPKSKQVSRNDAVSLYEVLSEEIITEPSLELSFEIADSSSNPTP